jgi:hypothetical protein
MIPEMPMPDEYADLHVFSVMKIFDTYRPNVMVQDLSRPKFMSQISIVNFDIADYGRSLLYSAMLSVRLSVCLSVCLSVYRDYISPPPPPLETTTSQAIFLQNKKPASIATHQLSQSYPGFEKSILLLMFGPNIKRRLDLAQVPRLFDF